MVELTAIYEGGLRVTATHGPSGDTLRTDAPVDNRGRGEAFSPTDLVATALGTCILTILGIQADLHDLDVGAATVRVEKHMAAEGTRRIARLPTELVVPGQVPEALHERIERALLKCPVRASLLSEIEAPLHVTWANSQPPADEEAPHG